MNPEKVQGTNDSSIVSKLSMVERGYFNDPFIKHFVEKPSRRSPLINRCYFARAAIISYSVEKFLEAVTTPCQIISLGAGFDTTYFRLKEKGLMKNLHYIEVDFPDVMKRKIALAKRGDLLKNEEDAKFETEEKSATIIYRHFKQIGGPLLAIDEYPTIAKQVERHRSFGFEYSSATSGDRFYSHYIDEEKRKFVENLEIFDEFEAWHRTAQHYFLLCSTNSQHEMLQKFASNLFRHEELHTNKDKAVQCHYTMQLKYTDDEKALIQRFGHCSCLVLLEGCEYAVVLGGFGIANRSLAHQRLHNSVCLVNTLTGELHHCVADRSSENLLNFPMFGTAVGLQHSGKQTVLLFGGRSSPTKCTNCLVMLTFARNETENTWIYNAQVSQSSSSLPDPRWRHRALALTNSVEEEYMIVSGGRNAEKIFGDFWHYDVKNDQWTPLKLSGEMVSPRHSHSMCNLNNNTILVSGGLCQNEAMSRDLFQVQFQDQKFTSAIVTRVVFTNPLPPLYSHTSHCEDDVLFLVGGVTSYTESQYGDEGPRDMIQAVDLNTGKWSSYSLADDTSIPTMLHNHSSVLSRVNKQVVILGGGDNCFSFGTWFNRSPFMVTLQ